MLKLAFSELFSFRAGDRIRTGDNLVGNQELYR
jgi:hypothetical protein